MPAAMESRPMHYRSRLALLSALSAVALASCADDASTDRASLAASGPVKSQLRGYDLGPPFPAGFRDSGLVNGYGEGEWVPFVAAIDGRTLEVSDQLEGDAGDGRY